MDEPLREVGPDLVPVQTPTQREETPNPASPTVPAKPLDPIPASPSTQSSHPKKRKPQQTEKSVAQAAAPDPSMKQERAESVATPKAESQVGESSFRESAKEFASGFGKGVRDEGERMYRDVKELPERIARTGRELVEDVKEGRKLRALAPIEAMGHAIQNASLDDVERLAHGVVDSARDWYHKPAKEKGESLGHASMSIASDAAMAALTDGLGTVAGLRKAEKAAEAAEHVRDAERVVERTKMLGSSGTQVTSKTVWKHEGMRLDVENPNPGKRPGQVHFQHGEEKYVYDPELRQFRDAPRAVNEQLKDGSFRQGIEKALRILGEDK
jgi:hypothetical protein